MEARIFVFLRISRRKDTPVGIFADVCQFDPGGFFLVGTHDCSGRNAGKNRDGAGGDIPTSPEHLILVGDKQKEVRLHLAGSKSDLDSIDLDGEA